MKTYALLAMFVLASLAFAQATSAQAQPDLIYVHLTKPGATLSAQPLTLAVATEMRSGEGGLALTYLSQQAREMRAVLGNDGKEIYLQIEAKYASSLAGEIRWLSQIGALSGIDENDISQISSLAATSKEIFYSSSAGWTAPSTAAAQNSPLASKIWEEQAAAEKEAARTPSSTPQTGSQPSDGSQPAGTSSTPDSTETQPTDTQQPTGTSSASPVTGQQPTGGQQPTDIAMPSSPTTDQKTPQDSQATPTSIPSTIGETAEKSEAQKTAGTLDANSQPQKGILDFASLLAPLLTAAAVILVAIVAVLLRSPSNEQIETHRILSSPTRVEILNELSTNEKIPTDLSSRIGKSKATVIEHLERMREAGFVDKVQTPGKKFVYYRITSKGKTALLRSAA